MMIRNGWTQALAVCMTVAALVGSGHSVGAAGQAEGLSSTDAMAIAARAIGLTDSGAATATATLSVPTDDATPFVRGSMNGRRCWLVEFDNLKLTLDVRGTQVANEHIRALRALVDATSGQLLRVWSPERISSSKAPRGPEEREDSISMGPERWLGFPTTPPGASLLSVLSYLGWSPDIEEIDAVYVLARCPGEAYQSRGEPRPTWSITLRASVPFAGFFPTGREQGDTSVVYGTRLVYEAVTGTLVYATNCY